MKLRPFKPKIADSLVVQITEFLTKEIISGRMPSGARLVERQLQQQFGVSRAPIRESLRILEKSGFVDQVPRKGAFVRKISRKDVDNNFMLRANLEGLAARLAIDYLTLEDIQKMEKALKRMHEATMTKKVENYLRYHNEFHEIFINACENRALIEILHDLRKIASWLRVHSTKYSISTHREIVDLLINKAADKVEALVKEHILAARNRFLEVYENREDR